MAKAGTIVESHIEPVFTQHCETFCAKQVEKHPHLHTGIHKICLHTYEIVPKQRAKLETILCGPKRYSRSANESPLVRPVGTECVRAKPDHPVVSVDGNLPQVNLELAWLGRILSVRVPAGAVSERSNSVG